jgi:phosphotransferase system HPr-like phosphotransfer protein
MLAAELGSELVVEANGEQAEEAVSVIVKMVENGFGES